MHIRNETPFPPFYFPAMDVAGRLFGVIVMRGTFRVVPDRPLVPVPEQEPVIKTDTFFGEPARSSLRFESDLSPLKRRADIHIHAVAHAPGGWAAPRWQVRARVGVLEKRLIVCGPRQWVRDRGRYRLTDPEACESVPVRYENAFGGVYRSPWGELDTLHENPIGKGYVGEGESANEPVIPAPQIEALGQPVTEIGRRHRPEGLGPIFRAWLPRRARAGTCDERWLLDRWPELPLDFDFRFFESAHPDLVYPGFLRGGEEIELEGMDPRGALRCSLPLYALGLMARLRDGSSYVAPLVLDTLVIDVEERRAYLTWRGLVQPPGVIQGILVRMQKEE